MPTPDKQAVEAIVVASGEIDVHTAPALRDDIDAAGSSPRIVIDMSGVDFIDSTGLGVLVSAHKKALVHKKAFAIRAPSSQVVKLFEITGLDGILTIE